MLERILGWSVHHRYLVIAAACILIPLGVRAFLELPIDAFPDTTPVQVQVNAVAPSLSPLEVERQITFPIEQSISGLPGLAEVRSISKFGLSQVTAIFEDGADLYLARQVVSERLDAVELPPGIGRPTLGPVATGLGEVFHYLVTSEDRSLSEVRTIQEWVIEPQLRSVPGVAEVNTWGGDDRQIHVRVDPVRLAEHDVSLAELVDALERNNANVGGGTLDQAGRSTLVQGIGIVTEPQDLEEIIVATRDGVPIRVRDLARVVDGREIRRGAVTANAEGEAVLGLGFMLMGENSHEVTRALGLRLQEVRRSLPAGVDAHVVYDRTALVDNVLHTVRTNLVEGAILVIAVLFAFLGHLRAGLIVASAIPLSMLFAFDLMLQAGIAGTLMSLGAIDFGLIVDSAVIQVENAVRRLGDAAEDADPVEVVRQAAIEVRRPTLFGELIIMIVYLPILTLEGVEGKLFRPMALTVIFALLGSLLLSLTLIPALSAAFLRKPRRKRKALSSEGSDGPTGVPPHSARTVASAPPHDENWFVRALLALYRPSIAFVLRHPRPILASALLLVGAGAFLGTRLGSEFMPRLKEGALVINTIRLAGVSVDESIRYGTKIEALLKEEFPDEIEEVWTRTGTAEVATDAMGLEVSDVFLTLRPRKAWTRAETQEELVAEMDALLGGMPGMRYVFTQPIEMRLNEMIAGIRGDVGVKLFGDDFSVLTDKAAEIRAIMESLPGAADIVTEQLTGQPVLEIEVDREAIGRHGIPAGDVLEAIAALGTREVGVLQEGERRFPVAVSLDDRYRLDAASVGRILVASPNGDRVPLEQLTEIRRTEGPSTVQREWAKRRVIVQGNVRDRDVGSYVAELRQRLASDLELPAGYYVRLGGQFENFERARTRLYFVVPVALALIFGLLYLTYHRFLDAARVFTGVPFAAVGGIVALWLRGMPFSISAAVGFIALSGVSVLADMVLVSTIRQNLADGMPFHDAIRTAAERRLRPVLMTGLVAALGFVPMALNTGIGAEVQRPLATVVIGGMLSSTLLTLFVLPVIFQTVGRRR
ncbi:MAG: efflux RND transporter permease subunit [Candidatus Eisenbacteria bacterium]|nr:efflux RND transporter permease subunit [Candidatus Eisenbacteria bacterium]